MKSKFKKLMAAALVLCLMLALLPAGVLAEGQYSIELEFDSKFGTVTVDKLTAKVGEKVTITSVPIVGYYTSSVKYSTDEKPQEELAVRVNGTYDYQFTMPESNVTVTVSYGVTNTENITIVENENCTITTDQAEKAYPDQTVQIIVSDLKSGYSVDKYSVITDDDMGGTVTVNSDGTFIMPQAPVKVSVTLKYTPPVMYNVTSEVTGTGGQISTAQPSYEVGSNVQVTVTPDEGYRLKSLTMSKMDGSGSQPIEGGYTFTMPAYDVKLVAEFEQNVVPPAKQYSVYTRVDGHGGTIAEVNQMYAAGDTVTVSVSPYNGYELDRLYYYETGTGTVLQPVRIDKTTMTFDMPASNVMVVATFEPIENYKFNINVDTDTHCKAKYQSTAEPGEWVEVCIDDFDPGYHLYSVTFNDDLVTDDVYWYNGHWHYSFRMPWHDVDIYVATTDKFFVNTVYDINGGAVEVWVKDAAGWDSTIFADAGDWVCFKATPKSGYEVGDISVTGRWYGKAYDAYYNRYDGCYYFKMPHESVNLSVSFVDKGHKVTVKDVTNGSLSVNTKWAVEDERVYITAVPDKGYELTWLYVKAADGSSVKVYEAIKEDTYYFFMPDQEVTVSAIFAYDYPDMPFIDVNPNSWYYSAIEFVYNKGIMNGVTASSFNPDGTITRGMIVTMLWRMAGEPSAVSAGFADVAADSYYAKAIAWAANNGIIEGYSASSFGPNDAITREQLATVLYRYAKYLGYTTTGSSLSGYYDASRVSSWAKDAMGWAVKNGVVTGLSSTWLNPNGTASRAEAAQMFMNFYEFLG